MNKYKIDGKIEYITGEAKNGKKYSMIKVLTGDRDIDEHIKPIFVSGLVAKALEQMVSQDDNN